MRLTISGYFAMPDAYRSEFDDWLRGEGLLDGDCYAYELDFGEGCAIAGVFPLDEGCVRFLPGGEDVLRERRVVLLRTQPPRFVAEFCSRVDLETGVAERV